MEQFTKTGIELLTSYGGKIVAAIVALVVGLILIKMLNKLAAKAIAKRNSTTL